MVSETFMVTALIAETNDLVLTVPRSVARVVRSPRMTVVTPPLDLPTIEVKQYWHERFDHDPGNMWLRSLIAECRAGHPIEEVGRASCRESVGQFVELSGVAGCLKKELVLSRITALVSNQP